MKAFILMCVMSVVTAFAIGAPPEPKPAKKEAPLPDGTRVYQTDSQGNIQYHKPSGVVVKGKLYQTGPITQEPKKQKEGLEVNK
jgi:hypothetical protein